MDVLALQQRLLSLGFNSGNPDGVFGRKTIAAVKAFQAARGLDIKFPGTVGPKTLAALGLPVEATMSASVVPPWVGEARRKVGLHEKLHNKSLRDWLKSDGHALGDPAKLPWCGDFMETVIAVTLPAEPMIVNPYWALNWKKFGQPIDLIALGAVAPFQRPGGGHIGIIVGHDARYFHVLGGNQSNAVSVTKIAKNRLSGPLRWPATYPLPDEALSPSTIDATITTNEA